VQRQHGALLAALDDPAARADRLCELNVIEQVRHVCETPVVQDAWARRQPLMVHGWIYALQDGLLRDLYVTIADLAKLDRQRQAALARLSETTPPIAAPGLRPR
jgi:carbonic anhydrase